MKRAMVLLAGSVLIVALVPGAAAVEPKDLSDEAPAPETLIYDAASALEFFKSLSGDWKSVSNGNEHGANYPTSSFEVVAAGSTVIQTVLEGQPNEMASIFHMDGDDLLLTHYCALENAPVLRFEESDTPGLLKFVFHGGTNFDPAVDAHFPEGTFVVKDKDTVESTFVVFAGGEMQSEGRSVMVRTD